MRHGSAALVLAHGDDRIRVEVAHVKALVAALGYGAAELAGLLARGGEHHA